MKEKTTIKQKHMKKILMMFALWLGVLAAWAQQSSGDYHEGLTRKMCIRDRPPAAVNPSLRTILSASIMNRVPISLSLIHI